MSEYFLDPHIEYSRMVLIDTVQQMYREAAQLGYVQRIPSSNAGDIDVLAGTAHVQDLDWVPRQISVTLIRYELEGGALTVDMISSADTVERRAIKLNPDESDIESLNKLDKCDVRDNFATAQLEFTSFDPAQSIIQAQNVRNNPTFFGLPGNI